MNRKGFVAIVALGSFAVIVLASILSAQGVDPEASLIELLRSPKLDDRQTAVAAASLRSSKSERLNLALMQALSEAVHYRQTKPTDQAGDDYYLDLVRIVTEWNDARAIPLLAKTVGESADSRAFLAALGGPAVEPLITFAVSDIATNGQIDGSLQALENMLQQRTKHEVSAAKRTEIRKLVELKLTRGTRPVIFASAARLGIALRDSALTRRISALLDEPQKALADYGITDPDEVNFVIHAIKRALARTTSTA